MLSFTIDVDAIALRANLEGSLVEQLKPFCAVAAKVSADHIRDEAVARLTRQLSGAPSRHPPPTVDQIKVKSDRTGWGWLVDAGNIAQPMLDRWLEFGTTRMHARPFFADSARLEETAHFGRIQAAVQAGLSEFGLGERQ